MLIGGITGAFSAGAGALAGGSSWLVQGAAQAAAGGASGATNAALFGGDIGHAAGLGAFFGFATFSIAGPLQTLGENQSNAILGTATYLAKSGVSAAVVAGAYAAATGEDIGSALARGFVFGVSGAAFNMTIGHTVGYFKTGHLPIWRDGAWFYQTDHEFGVTLGNVVTGDAGLFTRHAGCYSVEECGGSMTPKPTEYQHELAHIPQSYFLSYAYAPLHGLSMLVGSWIGGQGFAPLTAGHTYGFLERSWIRISDYPQSSAGH